MGSMIAISSDSPSRRRVGEAAPHEYRLGGQPRDARAEKGRGASSLLQEVCGASGARVGEGEEDVVEAGAAQGHGAVVPRVLELVERATQTRDGAVGRNLPQDVAGLVA